MTIKGFIAQSSGSGSMNTGTIRVAYFREWIGFFLVEYLWNRRSMKFEMKGEKTRFVLNRTKKIINYRLARRLINLSERFACD